MPPTPLHIPYLLLQLCMVLAVVIAAAAVIGWRIWKKAKINTTANLAGIEHGLKAGGSSSNEFTDADIESGGTTQVVGQWSLREEGEQRGRCTTACCSRGYFTWDHQKYPNSKIAISKPSLMYIYVGTVTSAPVDGHM